MTDHRLRDELMLVPTDFSEIAHPILHVFPERAQTLQQILSIGRQVTLLLTFGQHVQDNGISLLRIGVAGTVAAIMAHINGLVALQSGCQVFGRKVQQAIQSGGFVPVRTDLFPYAEALGPRCHTHKENRENGKQVFLHRFK